MSPKPKSKKRFSDSKSESPLGVRNEKRREGPTAGPGVKAGKAGEDDVRGFVFTDRTGKVHVPRGGHAAARHPVPNRTEDLDRTPAYPRAKIIKDGPSGKIIKGEGRVFRGEESESTEEKPFHKNKGKHRAKKFTPTLERDDPERDKPKRKDRRAHASKEKDQGFKTLKATIDKNRKGFGFLIFENRKFEDVFVPPRQVEKLFHGDRVEVTVRKKGEVVHIKVLEHRFKELVGRFSANPSKQTKTSGWLIYEKKRAREEVFIPKVDQPVEAGDWIRAKLEFHDEGPHAVTAQVVEVFGQELPPRADVAMIAAEYNLVEEHPSDSEKEAKTFELDLDRVLPHRTDLRKVPFITIDGETARDFDDAVYVERNKSGFILWVAIADVSHYVTPGSALDKDARSRGTSVYFPERAFHMLPRALSENLCSLKPNEPRLAMTAKIEFDFRGNKLSTKLFDSIIQSQRRATYNEIQAEWEANKKNKQWEFEAHFDLYKLLKQFRSSRGSIDFDLPEAELIVKPTGEPVSIKQRPRLDAHRLIEEFMIAANEAVTEWIMERDWPFVFRIHEEPAEQSMINFQKIAATVGVKFTVTGKNLSRNLAELVKKLEGHPAASLLNTSLLRSMKQAVYSSVHNIHFGLASPAYTHFTSPIRRYPDLVVHRLLRRALRVENGLDRTLKKADRPQLEKDLEAVAEHCSYRERLASDAEREAIKLKQVRIMLPKLGEEFEGKIVGMIESGMFVRLGEPFVEGMIPQDTMNDDHFEFNEEKMIFFGRRTKRVFRVGDAVKVKLARADVERRTIDFELIG